VFVAAPSGAGARRKVGGMWFVTGAMPVLRTLLALGALLAAALLGAAPAAAATADTTGGVLHFLAASGEFNELTIAPAGGRLVVSDPGASGLTAGPGCEADAGRLLCAGAGSIEVRTGDRADLVRLAVALPTTVFGGPSDDQIVGGTGPDAIDGETGADYVEGGAGGDRLQGGTGRDLLAGGAGDDELNGGDDPDELNGDAGNDALDGNEGSDRMSGGDGDDRFAGEAGNDSIDAGAGADFVDAGEGNDVVDVADGQADTVTCGTGADGARGDGVDRVELDCERLRDPNGRIVRTGPAPTDTSALAPLVPSPIVRVTGVVRGSRTQLQSLSVRAPSGSRVESRCRGRGCPYRKRVTRVRSGRGSVSLSGLRGRYRAGILIEVFVTQPERLGKYTSLRTRRGKPPLRSDGCARADVAARVKCPF
jgi:hypothetical protein